MNDAKPQTLELLQSGGAVVWPYLPLGIDETMWVINSFSLEDVNIKHAKKDTPVPTAIDPEVSILLEDAGMKIVDGNPVPVEEL